MGEQKKSLNYARLVNRQKFYREKSLKLERNLIFAREKLSLLEEKLKIVQGQSKTADHAYKKLQTEFSSLKTNYEALLEKYNLEQQKDAAQLADYQKKIDPQEKNQVRTDDIHHETDVQVSPDAIDDGTSVNDMNESKNGFDGG